MKDILFATTVPCRSSIDSSIASEIIVEARVTLSAIPTGEWRREMRARLAELEGTVGAWERSQPTEDERRRVTCVAINFFSDILEKA